MKIINIHRKATPNRGDLASAPCQYFPQLNEAINMDILGYKDTNEEKREKWLSRLNAADLVILGGGGLLSMPKFAEGIELVCKKDNVVVWGPGYNDIKIKSWNGLGEISIENQLQNAKLIGIRDCQSIYEWVPCSSCMSDSFDKQYETKHDIVVFENFTVNNLLPFVDELGIKKSQYMNNFKTPLNEVIEFLASGELVISNSFHGVYWATLLGKKVLGIPTSSKFYSLKHAVPLCSIKDWQRYSKLARTYPEALEECREANIKFKEKVMDKFKIS